MANEYFRLDWDGERVKTVLRHASMEGVEDAADHLLEVSQELAPYELGDLAASGAVSTDQARQQVAVSYDTVYAARQHEELTWRHAPGKQAKYLEQPMSSERETMLELIAERMREETGD